jgi:hypothetical protein
MKGSWRLCLLLLPLAGAAVAGLSGLELAGVVPRGALIGGAGDSERWMAVAFGALVQPFGWTALRHARLVVDDMVLTHLGFGFVCWPRTIPFADVRRWGHAVVSNRGRPERMLLFGLRGGDDRNVKLAMYTDAGVVLELLEARLGAAAPASASIAGVRFDGP